MKSINQYITEKLKIRKSSYKFSPKTKEELKVIIIKLIKERGNEGDFNDIDTSKITDMSELFDGIKEFNGDISEWNVSNVNDMRYMFYECESFNQDIYNWDVSNVKYKDNMFYKCPIKEKYQPKFR